MSTDAAIAIVAGMVLLDIIANAFHHACLRRQIERLEETQIKVNIQITKVRNDEVDDDEWTASVMPSTERS